MLWWMSTTDELTKADESFFGQLGEASCLQAIVLTGNFNHPNNI